MSGDVVAALIGLVVGLATASIWGRWRHHVLTELRAIRTLLQRARDDEGGHG